MNVRSCVLALLLAGCAGGSQPASDFSLTGARAPMPVSDSAATDEAIHADLIRGMLAQDNNYAALAHIQDQQRRSGNTPLLRYLEAEARRRLGDTVTAESLYRGLLRGEMSAQAHHGLGLLYAARDLTQAISFLREASQRRPTDADLRSDLGFALLRAGRYAESLTELATAMELDSASSKARNNLLLLLITTGDEAGVKRVAADTGVDAKSLARLRKQAQSLRVRNTDAGGRR